jgi:uncharacterized PurR-regulated membrane protein YhhQ (DUF165 family)
MANFAPSQNAKVLTQLFLRRRKMRNHFYNCFCVVAKCETISTTVFASSQNSKPFLQMFLRRRQIGKQVKKSC